MHRIILEGNPYPPPHLKPSACRRSPVKRQLLLAGGGFTGIYAPGGQLISQPPDEGQEGLV